MLVSGSIYQACKFYELFIATRLRGKCAIVTSYKPSPADIKGEETGEGLTEKLRQYDIYKQDAGRLVQRPTTPSSNREFESEVKKKFIDEPGQMKLLIVVDKLLTGFDAPSATYLYIDKQMRDHGLFQAICRVNRLDGEDKEYGYIIDYKDLFKSLERLDPGLHLRRAGRLRQGGCGRAAEGPRGKGPGASWRRRARRSRRSASRSSRPRDTVAYLRYFCARDTADKKHSRRTSRSACALQAHGLPVRAYADLANELPRRATAQQETEQIKARGRITTRRCATR